MRDVTSDPLAELNERFGIAGAVRFDAGGGGLARAVVTAPGAEAHVYLHGAHVTHFQPAGAAPVLFLSPASRFERGKAIRGGVPIVFPWFGARAGHPSSPDHGFARTSEWTVDSTASRDGGVTLALALGPSEATRALWSFDFRAVLRVEVRTALRLSLEIENPSDAAWSFEEALHTYLHVGDAQRAAITGLEGADYLDKTEGFRRKTLPAAPFQLTAETDRVFLNTRGPHSVTDPVLGRRLAVEKSGSANTVVWNPWRDRAAAMVDLGAESWRSMLCVETANVGDAAVPLAPGARHLMEMALRVEGGG